MNLVLVPLIFFIGLMSFVANAQETAIWIKGGAHLAVLPPKYRNIPHDDAGLMWQPDAQWQTVASHTSVVQFPPANIQWAKDEDLRTAFNDLKRRHIAMALGTGMLSRTPGCQQKTEAYMDPKELKDMLEKIRRNGGDLQYIVMDEPFFFGHIYKGPGACNEPVDSIARRISQSVAMARSFFPQIKIADVEVVNASRSMTEELARWVDAYRMAVGEPLAFLETDMDWSPTALNNLVQLAKILKQRNIPLAIIYNADAEANSDAAFEQSAIGHFTEIESGMGIHPAIASFDSWVVHPTHRLPEHQFGTLTNLVIQYLRNRSSLHLSVEGDMISGHLTDENGQGVKNEKVLVQAVDVQSVMGVTNRQLVDTVPVNAATVIIGIRANTEGSCVCSGNASATVGHIHYQEHGTGKQQDISPVTMPVPDAASDIRTLPLSPGKTFLANLRQFPVTGGATFTLSTPITATSTADHAGYVTIIFMDSEGKAIRRDYLWFSPSQQLLDTATTDEGGRFKIRLTPQMQSARAEIKCSFPGNNTFRPA